MRIPGGYPLPSRRRSSGKRLPSVASGRPGGGRDLPLLGLGLLVPSILFPLPSFAQAPDLRAKLDLAVTFDARGGDPQSARLYTRLGRPSTVGLSLFLESGLHVSVSQRLGRLPQDADADIFDEAFVEDPGIWRVGKQYLPFGSGRLLNESVLAIRVDSRLIAEDLPVALAFAQAGAGRQNGAVLRVGRGIGASFAYGEHFGIAATSLGLVRRPEDAPGRGGGWAQAYGIDARRRSGKYTLAGDFLALAGGPQRNLTVFDAEAVYVSDGYRTIGVGYSHTLGGDPSDFYRVFGRLRAARNLDVEPLVRLKGRDLYDLAVTLRLRL